MFGSGTWKSILAPSSRRAAAGLGPRATTFVFPSASAHAKPESREPCDCDEQRTPTPVSKIKTSN